MSSQLHFFIAQGGFPAALVANQVWLRVQADPNLLVGQAAILEGIGIVRG